MEALEDESYRRSAAYYNDVQEQFSQASSAMQMDIELWYRRLADNNGISYAAAKQLLKKNELEEFHWTVERYIQAGRENAVNQRWMKELENASAKFHISRLQAMKLQIQQHAELLFTEYEGGVADFLRRSFGEQYYRTAWEISHGTEVGYSLARIDERKIDTLIKRPWAQDGRNFSDRIWSNKEKLVNTLHTELSQCIIRGEAPRTAVERLARDMKVSRNQAGVLIMTETAALSSAAQKECFRELGVEQYDFLGTLDGQTCEVCQDMDKRVFRMADFEVGVTAPPIHPRCRCCTAPHFDDWEEFGTRLERAARDPGTDKTVYVDGKIDYRKWKDSLVSENQQQHTAKKGEFERKRPVIRLQGPFTSDIISTMDITKEWTKNKGIAGVVVNRQEYTYAGITYKVDGKHVVLHPTVQEKAIATVLSGQYGKTVEFVPQILYPQGIQTPDYLIDGERFDLKSPTGKGKNLLYGLIAKKKKQSHNFVIDVTECPLSQEELAEQIEDLYRSPRVGFLEKIVFVRDGKVEKVYSRK